jgi:hypothetical protein
MQQIAKQNKRSAIWIRLPNLTMVLVVVGSFLIMLLQGQIRQDQEYHAFADSRAFLGIPNFGDVASNLGFLLAGVAGLILCLRKRLGPLHLAWVVMFVGIALVGIGSSYYHWTPNDQTLLWDRMTLTIGFMGLMVGLIGEYIDRRLLLFLVPAILLGILSVLYWGAYDDLRIYYWVQLIPLLMLPFVVALYTAQYTHQWLFVTAAILYGLAKLTELFDKAIFAATQGTISGHTLKHLIAGAACVCILIALQRRSPIDLGS